MDSILFYIWAVFFSISIIVIIGEYIQRLRKIKEIGIRSLALAISEQALCARIDAHIREQKDIRLTDTWRFLWIDEQDVSTEKIHLKITDRPQRRYFELRHQKAYPLAVLKEFTLQGYIMQDEVKYWFNGLQIWNIDAEVDRMEQYLKKMCK